MSKLLHGLPSVKEEVQASDSLIGMSNPIDTTRIYHENMGITCSLKWVVSVTLSGKQHSELCGLGSAHTTSDQEAWQYSRPPNPQIMQHEV